MSLVKVEKNRSVYLCITKPIKEIRMSCKEEAALGVILKEWNLTKEESYLEKGDSSYSAY